VVRDLADNLIDLAVMGAAPAGLDTDSVPFARNPLAIIAAPEHPLVGKRRVRLAQLANETFLVREPGSGTRTAMERAFAAENFQPADTVEIGSNETIKQAVMANMGISFLSLHTAGLELASRRLSVITVAGMPVMREWRVIHRARKRLTPVAAAFREYLIGEGAQAIDRALRYRRPARKAS